MSEGPGPLQLAANYARAVTRHAADGFAVLGEAEVIVRLMVCTGESTGEACPHFRDRDGVPRCLHVGCGCWLERKASWRSEHCPLGKWPGDG